MARCGCNDECSCLLVEGPGVDILGSGSPNNPYVVEFDGSEVIANGLAWDGSGKKLSTKLAAGGGLEFDGAGAMKVVGGGGGGGGTGWTTIADLEARGEKVMIGHLGAGYMIKPESQIRSYQYGQQIGCDMLHVAVRFLNDGTPVVHADETLGRTIGEPWNAGAWTSLHVQEQDGHRWGIYPSMSGLDNPYLRNQPDGDTDPTLEFGGPANWAKAKWHVRSPSFGFLGMREQPQYGGTFLADVFREVGGRTPILLELRWPARDAGTGAFIRTTPAIRTDRFLRNVLSMIGRFGLTDHVVVLSTETSIPAQGVGNVDVLGVFSSAGIRVGPYLTSAKLATYPADGTWPASWTWAGFPQGVTDAQIAAYKALTPDGDNLRCVLYLVNRQSVWQQRVTTPGLLGGTSADPPYAFALAAGVPNHPLSGPTYRNPWGDWSAAVIQHGMIQPNEAAGQVSGWYRGIKEPGFDRLILAPTMIPAVAGTTFHILQGWGCPVPTPTNWSFDFEIAFDAFESPRTQAGWMALAFARNTDAVFSDWNPAPGVSVDAQSGYVLQINQLNTGSDAAAKNIVLLGYTGGAVTVMGNARTATPFATGVAKRFRVGLNPNGVRVSAVDGVGALLTLIEVRTDLAKAYRGEYFHLGRFSTGNQGWYGYFQNFRGQELGGSASGPL